tara:strand:+ start:1931 stop:2800 length:870 start_codon:yes stop_codon:yes gene_type:complete
LHAEEEWNLSYTKIEVDQPAEGVRRIMLDRDSVRNAQDKALLYELDDALKDAAFDDDVKCIIIGANGKHFSSGHDLNDRSDLNDFDNVTLWGGYDEPGMAKLMNREAEMYLGLCWRWRNLPKPTIVQVQGLCIAGGLMLVWPFDIVIASDDAAFSDPVVAFGVNGHEYFVHVWELGHRKAKEMLFCGSSLSAQECHRLGMVNHVVPRENLNDFTVAMAKRVAKRPLVGLRLAKMACNQSLDAQGQWVAVQSAFGLQQFGHANAQVVHGSPIDKDGAALLREESKGPPFP